MQYEINGWDPGIKVPASRVRKRDQLAGARLHNKVGTR
jgi:hypothetical protein